MRDQFNGDLRFNEPMSKHTSLRVGGPAEQFFIPNSVEDLSIFLKTLDSNLPILWLGRGSNLLVRDGGLSGVVVATSKISNVIEKVGKYLVRVGASIPCTKFARQCIRWKLGPSEFFSGIPGTIGGALSMNAGAFVMKHGITCLKLTPLTEKEKSELAIQKISKLAIEMFLVLKMSGL